MMALFMRYCTVSISLAASPHRSCAGRGEGGGGGVGKGKPAGKAVMETWQASCRLAWALAAVLGAGLQWMRMCSGCAGHRGIVGAVSRRGRDNQGRKRSWHRGVHRDVPRPSTDSLPSANPGMPPASSAPAAAQTACGSAPPVQPAR